MKSKLFSRTMVTIALGALCVGGTTVFAESLVSKLNPDEEKSPAAEATLRATASADSQNGTSLISSEPIHFDLLAGWDLQRPQLTDTIAKNEAAAARAAAQTAAAQASIAAAAAQAAAAAAPQATPAPATAPAATPAAKQAPIVNKAKTAAAAAKAKPAASAPAQTMAAADTQAAQAVQDHQGKSYTFKKVLNVTASAYSDAPEENGGYGGLDYYGNALKLGTIAVDPKVIPLGSSVLIKGYSFNGLPQTLVAKATDIGGAIQGNRIDIFIPGSKSFVNSFGLQKVQVYVLN